MSTYIESVSGGEADRGDPVDITIRIGRRSDKALRSARVELPNTEADRYGNPLSWNGRVPASGKTITLSPEQRGDGTFRVVLQTKGFDGRFETVDERDVQTTAINPDLGYNRQDSAEQQPESWQVPDDDTKTDAERERNIYGFWPGPGQYDYSDPSTVGDLVDSRSESDPNTDTGATQRDDLPDLSRDNAGGSSSDDGGNDPNPADDPNPDPMPTVNLPDDADDDLRGAIADLDADEREQLAGLSSQQIKTLAAFGVLAAVAGILL